VEATLADSSEQLVEEMETSPSISVTTPDGAQANGSLLRDYNASNSLNFSRSTSEVSGTEDSMMLPEMEYSIATHFVKVKRSGTLTDVTTLWDLVGTDAVSGSMDHLMDIRPGFERLPSINAFDRVSFNCRAFTQFKKYTTVITPLWTDFTGSLTYLQLACYEMFVLFCPVSAVYLGCASKTH